jgi:hypothetical protein
MHHLYAKLKHASNVDYEQLARNHDSHTWYMPTAKIEELSVLENIPKTESLIKVSDFVWNFTNDFHLTVRSIHMVFFPIVVVYVNHSLSLSVYFVYYDENVLVVIMDLNVGTRL